MRQKQAPRVTECHPGGHAEKSELTCKPGSVEDGHSSGTGVTARLKQPTREHVRAARRVNDACSPIWPCSGWGLPCHGLLPAARCALTAPFHPYLCLRTGHRRFVFCGTFHRLAPPRRYLAPCPMEPGLSSVVSRTTATARSTPSGIRHRPRAQFKAFQESSRCAIRRR